jgi:acyl-CoA thioesterase FadM
VSEPYAVSYEVSDRDLDRNGHVHYSAYIDAAAAVRYRFFAERGLPPESLASLGFAPVYVDLHARFLREVLPGETITITYTLAGLSPSARRWKVHHDILKSNGKKAVILDVEGVLLDLTSRAPAPPPPPVLAVLREVPRSPAFEELPEHGRR